MSIFTFFKEHIMSKSTSNSPTNSLPPPFNWIAAFIEKYFIKMPQWVQVTVFLAFVIFMITGFVRIAMPEVWEQFFDSNFVLYGEIVQDEPFTDQDQPMFTAYGLYTSVAPESPLSKTMKIAWILKIPKQEKEEPITFNLMKNFVQVATKKFSPASLAQFKKNGKVYLAYKEVAPNVGELSIQKEESGNVQQSTLLPVSLLSNLWNGIANIFLFGDEPAMTAPELIKKLLESQSPSSQVLVRQTLSRMGSPAMKTLAESLSVIVRKERMPDAALLAQALADFDSLWLLSSHPDFIKIFDTTFFASAAEILRKGNSAESSSIARLLYKLQDRRSIQSVQRQFRNSNNDATKELCIYVLSSFATNKNTEIKKEVKNILNNFNSPTLNAKQRKALTNSLTKFEK